MKLEFLNKYLKIFIILSSLFCLQTGISAQDKAVKKKDTTFKKAVRYFYQRKFEMAELLLQEELKKNPENELAYSYLGDIFLSKKRYEPATTLYQKALDLNPKNAENYFRLGQAYYHQNLANVAIQNFQKAYNIDKRVKFAHYHLGLTYLILLREKKGTIRHWETYLKIAPEDPQYEKIRRAIELLKDPNFIIPPLGSDISIEEALHLGGLFLKKGKGNAKDKSAGHEKKKTVKKIEEIYRDDDDL
jgi:tetratricopeptide (TPR) repeat protein